MVKQPRPYDKSTLYLPGSVMVKQLRPYDKIHF